jgi:hypothetical protein
VRYLSRYDSAYIARNCQGSPPPHLLGFFTTTVEKESLCSTVETGNYLVGVAQLYGWKLRN